jgi:hypothetical protein
MQYILISNSQAQRVNHPNASARLVQRSRKRQKPEVPRRTTMIMKMPKRKILTRERMPAGKGHGPEVDMPIEDWTRA